MDYDGLEEIFDLGAYSKPKGFSLRRIITALLL